MTLGGKRLCVAIPDTILEEHETVRDKTMKLGQIARYCSIFGVDSVKVFHDPRGRGESRFIKLVLEYLETPQYLRRRLFPLSEDLRFAGLLPPLRIPSHKPKMPVDKLRPGEFREGVVLADGTSVDIGFDVPAQLRRKEPAQKRVTVKITQAGGSRIEGVLAERTQVPEYWGYTVEVVGPNSLKDPKYPLTIATSRKGDPLASVAKGLRAEVKSSSGIMMIFGPPSKGLFEVIGKDLRERFRFVVNLFPEQRVATVRSEEAIFSALYLLELLSFSETGLP